MFLLPRITGLVPLLLAGLFAADVVAAASPHIREVNGSMHIRVGSNQTVFINDVDVIKELKELKELKSHVAELQDNMLSNTENSSTTPAPFVCEPGTAPMPAPPSAMCSVFEPLILDCNSESSRSSVAESGACEVNAVINCCCDEFYSLTSVQGPVLVKDRLPHLWFGNVSRIGGSVDAAGKGIQSVDFGALTSVESDFLLDNNPITAISFKHLAFIGGRLKAESSVLSTIDFGALTRVEGELDLNSNRLTSVRFNNLAYVGYYVNLAANDLLFIDVCGLQTIKGRLYLNDNIGLGSVDCKGADIQRGVFGVSTLINCD